MCCVLRMTCFNARALIATYLHYPRTMSSFLKLPRCRSRFGGVMVAKRNAERSLAEYYMAELSRFVLEANDDVYYILRAKQASA